MPKEVKKVKDPLTIDVLAKILYEIYNYVIQDVWSEIDLAIKENEGTIRRDWDELSKEIKDIYKAQAIKLLEEISEYGDFDPYEFRSKVESTKSSRLSRVLED